MKYYLCHKRGEWLILDSEDRRLKGTNSLNAGLANSIDAWYQSAWNLTLGPFNNIIEPKYHKINRMLIDVRESIKRGYKKYNIIEKYSPDDIKSLKEQEKKLVGLINKLVSDHPHYFI